MDFEHELEKTQREKRERTRQLLISEGRPDLVEEFDQNMRDIDLGVTGARSTWHSLSNAQRMLIELMVTRVGRITRTESSNAYHYTKGEEVQKVSRLSTVRALIARGLLSVDGGAFDPESSVVVTEKAKFVFQHGRTPETSEGDSPEPN